MNFSSWKTGLGGIFCILPQVLHLIFPKTITPEVANVISGIAAGYIGIAAKDSNVTGGTVVNSTNDANVVASSATTSLASNVPVAPNPPVQ